MCPCHAAISDSWLSVTSASASWWCSRVCSNEQHSTKLRSRFVLWSVLVPLLLVCNTMSCNAKPGHDRYMLVKDLPMTTALSETERLPPCLTCPVRFTHLLAIVLLLLPPGVTLTGLNTRSLQMKAASWSPVRQGRVKPSSTRVGCWYSRNTDLPPSTASHHK